MRRPCRGPTKRRLHSFKKKKEREGGREGEQKDTLRFAKRRESPFPLFNLLSFSCKIRERRGWGVEKKRTSSSDRVYRVALPHF